MLHETKIFNFVMELHEYYMRSNYIHSIYMPMITGFVWQYGMITCIWNLELLWYHSLTMIS
jgi:hypothetical protein